MQQSNKNTKWIKIANEAPFMTKELHREITKTSRLRNNFLRTKFQIYIY